MHDHDESAERQKMVGKEEENRASAWSNLEKIKYSPLSQLEARTGVACGGK